MVDNKLLLYKNKRLRKKIFVYLDFWFNQMNLMDSDVIFVIDIHNVFEYDNDNVDHNIIKLINKIICYNYPIIILSVDTQLDRINFNENLINSVNTDFCQIPKIFTHHKNKGKINKYIHEFFNKTKKYPPTLVIIDDNIDNIKDTINNIDRKHLICFNYTRHISRDSSTDNISVLDNILVSKQIF